MPYFHHFLAESSINKTSSNKCCHTLTPRSTNGLGKAVKSGYLLYFKKKMFCKSWREAYVVLYEDSSIVWFRDRDRIEAEGEIFLKDAPEMLAAGQWTSRVPLRPEFPAGCNPKHSIAIGSRYRDKVVWFLCKSETELIEWMSAINFTLPLPPPPPEELRVSKRQLTSSGSNSDVTMSDIHRVKLSSKLRHQPSAPDLFLNKTMNHRGASKPFQNLSGKSSSMGRMNHIDSPSTSVGTSSSGRINKRQFSRSSSFKETENLKIEAQDIAPALMVAAIMTQWNSGSDCWDWGMGWGWAGWSASFCDTCAIEHAAVSAHVASTFQNYSAVNRDQIFSDMLSEQKTFHSSHHDLFNLDDDNDVTELGDTDVACDFGGDFGGF